MTASGRQGLASEPPPARGAVGQTGADPAKPRNRFTGTPAPDHRAPSCPMGFCLQPAGWICLGPWDPKDRALSVPRHGGSGATGWRWVCVHSCLWDLWVFWGKVNFRENSRWSRERHACLLERAREGVAGPQRLLVATHRPVHLAVPEGMGTSTPRALCPAKLHPPTRPGPQCQDLLLRAPACREESDLCTST